MMNEFDQFPSLNLTVHHTPAAPIYASTPLIGPDKAPSSTSSSFFLPLTENTSHSEQLIKLNEVS